MGWGPNDPNHRLGSKFAKDISKHDVILIARRLNGKPEVVGYGIVSKDESVIDLEGFTAPDTKWRNGTIRRLSNFIFGSAYPEGIPMLSAVNHRQSLCELHPSWDPDHRRVCAWLSESLGLSVAQDGYSGGKSKAKLTQVVVRRTPHIDPAQFDFSQQSAAEARIARKLEAELVRDYKKWLGDSRIIEQILYGRLACDAYEKARNNLIEAKSSIRREYIRMAVGQLMDYAFLGKAKFKNLQKAILLPKKPEPEILNWLDDIKISVIWRQKKTFVDNAGGQFT